MKEEEIPKFDTTAQTQEASKTLKVLQDFPLIAETTSKHLVASFITPNDEFFIRGHQAIPQKANPDKYKLKIFDTLKAHQKPHEEGDDLQPFTKIRFSDLKTKFAPHKVMTAMSCAGNRRLGMKEHSLDVQGNSWYVGAIGNTVYTGVLITDLLRGLGFNLEELKDKHLVAESMDIDVQGKAFSVSVPMSLVLDPLSEVMIAFEMNGQDIPIEHGYPLRLVVPGTVGVRNAKWVRALYISDEEAKSSQ